MQKLRLSRIFIVSVFLVGFACSKNAHHGSSSQAADKLPTRYSDQKWNNPILEHRLTSREVPIRNYPFAENLSDRERVDPTGFNEFITRMNASFEASNLSSAEADLVYAVIQKSDLLKNQSAATSQGEMADASLKMPMEKVKNRVALKKTGTRETFSIFYKKFDCGWNYSNSRIELNPRDSALIKVEEIETWVARTPC